MTNENKKSHKNFAVWGLPPKTVRYINGKVCQCIDVPKKKDCTLYLV